MNALQTAALVYLAAGITCWVVLAVAYARRGGRSGWGLRQLMLKALIALPVVVAWPMLVVGLVRREARADLRRGER
jgi:hypothetical protein